MTEYDTTQEIEEPSAQPVPDQDSAESDSEQVDLHKIEITYSQKAPSQIYAGCDMELQVKVSCRPACDLRGDSVEILDGHTVAKQVELTTFSEEANETDLFTLQAPIEPGEYTWTIVYTSKEENDNLHEPSSIPLTFTVMPHAISLSSWGAPFPVEQGSKFTLNAGARCSGGCRLTGETIEVYDHNGAQVALGVLGEDLKEGTTALYWTELELKAADEVGFYKWELKCSGAGLELPHKVNDHSFAFRIVRPPEHVVTVQIKRRSELSPFEEASVTLKSEGVVYRAFTDDTGAARINVPKGEYEAKIVAYDHSEWTGTVKVNDDVTVEIEPGMMLMREDFRWF